MIRNVYDLRSIKGTRRLADVGHADAIRAARRMDEELQPVYGVEVWLVARGENVLDEPVRVGTHDGSWRDA